MDKTLVAIIKVARLNSTVPIISTGYAVMTDRLLIANHALLSTSGDYTKPITVEWPLIKDPETGSKPMRSTFEKKQDVLFEGSAQCDVAVVKCKTPAGTAPFPMMFTEQYPDTGETWDTYGFPAIGRNSDANGATDAMGKTNRPNHHSPDIALDVGTELKKPKDWKGISGAPIFTDSKLIGIIVEKNTGHDHRLDGVSIPYLLKSNKEFCRHTGYKTEYDSFKPAEKLLKKHKQVHDLLLNQLSEDKRNLLIENIKKTLQYFANIVIGELISHIISCQKEAAKDKSLCKLLAQFLLAMLPNLFDNNAAKNIKNSLGDTTNTLIAIPYASTVSAEMLMANADNRQAMFKYYTNKDIQAQYRMPLPPEMGSDDGSEFEKAITDHFYNSFGGEIEKKIASRATNYLYDEVVLNDIFLGMKEKNKSQLVKKTLENRAKKNGASYYWLIQLPVEDNESKRQLQDLARKIKDTYPYIVLLVLEQNPEIIIEDHDIALEINEVLSHMADK